MRQYLLLLSVAGCLGSAGAVLAGDSIYDFDLSDTLIGSLIWINEGDSSCVYLGRNTRGGAHEA